MLVLRIVIAILSIIFFIGVCFQVSKGRLLLRYSLLWMGLSIVALIIVAFPEILYYLSSAVGFVMPSNFVFFIVLFFSLAISLSLSIVVSRQQMKIKNLVQELALLEYGVNENREKIDQQ